MLGTLGEIRMFGGDYAPQSWMLCEGQRFKIIENEALFSLISNIYGGDGKETFCLPDLRGRTCVQQGRYEDFDYALGYSGGQQATTLSTSHLPPHTHPMNGEIKVSTRQPSYSEEADVENPLGRNPAKIDGVTAYHNQPDGKMAVSQDTIHGEALITESTGRGQPFNLYSPYLGINFIICIHGQYPKRG
jgi:microcystin-dependent protein